MFQMIYLSQTNERLTDSDLDHILKIARDNNRAAGLTGMLLYASTTFLQVIEGPRPVVEAFYDRIFMDQRHKRVRLLAAREVPGREFDRWHMGFRRLEGAEATSSSFFELSKSTLPDVVPRSISEDTIKYLRGFSDAKVTA